MSDEAFRNVLTELSRKGMEHVDCIGLGLTDDQLDLLITAMEHAPLTTKTLYLSDNNITSAGVPFLLRYLEFRQVDELVLRNNQIDEAAALSFLTLFQKERDIKLLDLRNNTCLPLTAARLYYLSQSSKFSTEIHQALLSGCVRDVPFCGLQHTDLDRDLLQFLLVEASGLQTVDFSGIDISGAVMNVIGNALRSSTVKALRLRDCSLTNDAVMKLVETANLPSHEYLSSLDLSNNMNLTNDLVRKLITVLFDKNSTITTCDLSNTSITAMYRNHVQKDCELSKEHSAVKRAVVDLRNNAPTAAEINLQWDGPLPTCMSYLAEPLAHSTIVQKLNVSNSRIDDVAMGLLAQALQKNTSLKSLELANCSFTAAGVKALFEVLASGRCNVQEVNIANNNLGEDAVKYVVAALQANPKLTEINIDVNPAIPDDAVQAVAGLTMVNKAPPQIRKMLPAIESNTRSLTAVDFSDSAVIVNDDSVWLLTQALRSNGAVRVLDFSHNSIGDRGAHYLAAYLRENNSIAELNLSFNCIGNRGANAICDALLVNNALRVLNLSNNVMDIDGVKPLTVILRTNHSLREIHLAKTRVPEEFVAQVQLSCRLNCECPIVKNAVLALRDNDTTLHELQLQNRAEERAIDDESMRAICSALRGKPYVHSVDASGNSIGAAGCAELAAVLSSESCPIVKLNLSKNPVDDYAATELAKCFAFTTTLQEVDLRGTSISEAGVAILAKSLERNASLLIIHIPGYLEGEEVATLQRNLALNCGPKALKELIFRIDAGDAPQDVDFSQLEDGQLNDALCQILCGGLAKVKALRTLNISNNNITTASVPHIVEVIELCPALYHLDLSNNKIGERGGGELLLCVERIAHLRSVLLTGNGVTEETHQRILQLVTMNLGSEKLKQLVLSSERGELLAEELDLNGRTGAYQLTDQDLFVLASVLQNRTEVKSLDLGSNSFSDAGCIALAEVLRLNHSLEALNLADNRIGHEGGEALYYALRINPQLQCLNVERTYIPKDILEDITSLLHVNQTTFRRKVDMRDTKVYEISDETQFRSTDYHAAQAALLDYEAANGRQRESLQLLN